MSKGFRTTLKGFVPEKIWPLLRWFDKYLTYCQYVWLWLKRRRVYPTIPLRSDFFISQSVAVFPVTVEYNGVHPERISSQLKAQGYTVFEGRHSIYLGNADDIERFCPALIKRYPEGFGLKIVKSQAISKDSTPYYTSCKIAPASTWFSVRAVGSMMEKMTVSNVLYLEGVAPRVYDIIQLITGKGTIHFAFVVEHIKGAVLTGEPAGEFMKVFKAALSANSMETISIKEHRDLRAPEYNRNIVSGESSVCYVDIQNFVLSDKNMVEGIKNERWDFLLSFESCRNIVECLDKENIPLNDQKILLAGHSYAGLLPGVLSCGARWCSVVLHDEVVRKKYEKALYLYGMSRFDLLSVNPEPKQEGRGFDFSAYEMICLDESSLLWFKRISHRLSVVTYLLYFGDKENDVNTLQHIIEKSMVKKINQIKALDIQQEEMTLMVFKLF